MQTINFSEFSLFVKNNVVYKLNNYKVQVVDQEPLQVWLRCRSRTPGAMPLVGADRYRVRARGRAEP